MIKTISSRDNPLFKELKQLATSSQARRKAGRTLLDGIHLCQFCMEHGSLPQLCVVSETSQGHPEVADILGRCTTQGVTTIRMPDALYHALSQVEHGVDILFLIDIPTAGAVPPIQDGSVLLDNVQDPGNLGSILRSAAAAGVVSAYCSPGTAFSWSPKVLRAGMGAHFLLKIYENVDLAALLHRSSVPVVATSSHAAQRLYDLDLTRPVAWLFGHEGQGVADALLALATHEVAIPHLGAMESLNVAASAAICFFEQVRQKTA